MKTLVDSPELREKRLVAYRAGLYRFNVPPVCTVLWDVEAWCNWVQFNDKTLTGFLPYTGKTE